jgi:hypothetical protein
VLQQQNYNKKATFFGVALLFSEIMRIFVGQ